MNPNQQDKPLSRSNPNPNNENNMINDEFEDVVFQGIDNKDLDQYLQNENKKEKVSKPSVTGRDTLTLKIFIEKIKHILFENNSINMIKFEVLIGLIENHSKNPNIETDL